MTTNQHENNYSQPIQIVKTVKALCAYGAIRTDDELKWLTMKKWIEQKESGFQAFQWRESSTKISVTVASPPEESELDISLLLTHYLSRGIKPIYSIKYLFCNCLSLRAKPS